MRADQALSAIRWVLIYQSQRCDDHHRFILVCQAFLSLRERYLMLTLSQVLHDSTDLVNTYKMTAPLYRLSSR